MDSIPGKTEIKRILNEVEKKKDAAKSAGLDRLFLDAYHRSIRYFPVWAKNIRERQYVHPEVSDPASEVIRNAAGDIFVTEFSMGGRRYRIVSQRKNIFFAYDIYYSMELFMDGVKKFALHEKHGAEIQGTRYYTLDIEAYISDEWVSDFRKIKQCQEEVEEELAREIMTSADTELMNRLKRNFDIRESELAPRLELPRFLFLPEVIVFLIILGLTIFLLLNQRP